MSWAHKHQQDEIDRLLAINAELLEAAERTLAALICTDVHHHEIHERARIVEQARAAIAKATGGT